MATGIKKFAYMQLILEKLYGVRLDFNKPMLILEEEYQEFCLGLLEMNTGLYDKEYTKYFLIQEAYKLFLKEIAPKRPKFRLKKKSD